MPVRLLIISYLQADFCGFQFLSDSNIPEYLGVATSAERFKRINSNGQPVQNYVMEGGKPKCKIITEQDRPLCFCYTDVCEHYGINLSTFLSDSLDDEPTETKQEELPF